MDLDIEGIEAKWIRKWEDLGFYSYKKTKGARYTTDTPPPTVSGEMHIGHVFAYPLQDFTARYKRMRGYDVYYPWGFDDNGLPTERLTEKTLGVRGSDQPLDQFREMVRRVSKESEDKMLRSFKSLGISAAFDTAYRTVSPEVIALSQKLFLDLVRKGIAYTADGPTIWCPACRTAIAQADLKDMERNSDFVTIAFSSIKGELLIATTRPELLGACVALAANPGDERYKSLFGTQATVPLYGNDVPIIGDESVDMNKGTGIEMVCTFGDQNDMEIWRRKKLNTRVIVTRNGKISDTGILSGLGIPEARKAIIEKLLETKLVKDRTRKKQVVNVHERCDTPVEILVSRQWFVHTMDEKGRLRELGRKIQWFPEYMRTRFENWIDGMKWDWLVSRQRFYGVPFPVWYCNNCGEMILASEKDLPLDPRAAMDGRKCTKCGSGSISPDTDVMDTWLTSSISPCIVSRAIGDPCDTLSARFQGHDIISTWAYTSIVRALHNSGKPPWNQVVLNGIVTDPLGQKVSKSRGNAPDLDAIHKKYGADALRYWSSSTVTGEDAAVREQDFVRGRRLVIKIFNASRLVSMMSEGVSGAAELQNVNLPFNRWVLSTLGRIVSDVTAGLEEYSFARARSALDNFFWNSFCDNYLEIAKSYRSLALSRDENSEVQEIASVASYAMIQILKLYAPFLPFITEESYAMIPNQNRKDSIHLESWPEDEFSSRFRQDEFEPVLEVIDGIRAYRSSRKPSPGGPIESLTIVHPKEMRQYLPLFSAMFKISKINSELGETLSLKT